MLVTIKDFEDKTLATLQFNGRACPFQMGNKITIGEDVYLIDNINFTIEEEAFSYFCYISKCEILCFKI